MKKATSLLQGASSSCIVVAGEMGELCVKKSMLGRLGGGVGPSADLRYRAAF
jgi:hypothetical protein